MSHSSPYLGTPEHLLDIETVSSAQNTELERRIIDLDATPSEVISWYASADPLAEAPNLDWLKRRYDSSGTDRYIWREQMRQTVIHMMIDEGASLTILADKAGMLEADGTPIKPWVPEDDPKKSKLMIMKTGDFGKQLMDRALNNIAEDDLNDLYIAADCMFSAALDYSYTGNLMARDKQAFPESDALSAQAVQYTYGAYEITKAMYAATLLGRPPEELQAARPTVHKLASFMCSISFELGHMHPGIEPNDYESKAYQLLVSAIDLNHITLGDETAKTIKGTEKGDLYELLYLMDLNYLFSTNRTERFNWFARATTARHDKPLINNPSRRHGYDFLAYGGDKSLLIQAKANKEQERRRKETDPHYREYHPWILEVAEEKFQDVFKPRLAKKLNAYLEWLEAGMPQEGHPAIDRMLLQSAREGYAASVAENNLKPSERMIRKLGEDNLTRAERRRIQRSCGDFKKRKGRR